MAYYDFAKELFQFIDQIEIDYNVKYHQGHTECRRPPSVSKLCDTYPDRFKPILDEINERLKEDSFKTGFLLDWKNAIRDELDYQYKCFKSDSSETQKLINKCLEENYGKKLEYDFEQVLDLIKSNPMVCDYKVHLLGDMYNYYRRKKNPYQKLEGSRFKEFYREKNEIFLKNCIDNYDLVECGEVFEIQKNVRFKLHDKLNDTDLFISSLLPDDFIEYLVKLNEKNSFRLAIRPNYNICGEKMHIRFRIDEAVIRGNLFQGRLDCIPEVTSLLDYDSQDYFVVRREEGIVFEELLDDFKTVEPDCVVTQGVHLQYEGERITHLDHEFFFYSVDSYDQKLKDIRKHGYEKYKTFKIDNASIPFEKNASDNVLYKTLHTFFKNHTLIDEYFEKMIQEKNIKGFSQI